MIHQDHIVPVVLLSIVAIFLNLCLVVSIKVSQFTERSMYRPANEILVLIITMRGSRRGVGGPDPPENHKNIGFLSNTGPDPMENHKATKPAFNVNGVSLVGR